jgi:hypothetical protein
MMNVMSVMLALALAAPAAQAVAGDTAAGGAKALRSTEGAGDLARQSRDASQRRYATYDESDLQRARRAVGALRRADPSLKRLFDEAVGYAVFPEMGTSDGPGGAGVLYEDGQAAGRATLPLPPTSLRTGGQPYSLVIFFGSRQAVAAFKQGGLHAAARARAVAVVAGSTTRVRFLAGVSVLTLGGGGVTEADPAPLAFGYLPYHREITASPR